MMIDLALIIIAGSGISVIGSDFEAFAGIKSLVLDSKSIINSELVCHGDVGDSFVRYDHILGTSNTLGFRGDLSTVYHNFVGDQRA